MAVITKTSKGSALTAAEMDGNWNELIGLLTRLGTFTASQTPGVNQIPVVKPDLTVALPIAQKVFRTASTGATTNQYVRVAAITVPVQYQSYSATVEALVLGSSSATVSNCRLVFNVKQQAAFGANPSIQVAKYSDYSDAEFVDFGYVIKQNSPTTIVEIYAYIKTTYAYVMGYMVAGEGGASCAWDSTSAVSPTQPAGWVAGTKTQWIGLNSSGNVGIGTVTPTEKLEVNGNFKANGLKLGTGTVAMKAYDEGSFTPALAGGTTAGSNTYSVRSGLWTRVGRMVFFEAQVSLSAKDAAMAGELRITGLPFTSANNGAYHGVSIRTFGALGLTTGYTQLSASVDTNTSYVRLLQNGSNQSSITVDAANATATTAIIISGFYTV